MIENGTSQFEELTMHSTDEKGTTFFQFECASLLPVFQEEREAHMRHGEVPRAGAKSPPEGVRCLAASAAVGGQLRILQQHHHRPHSLLKQDSRSENWSGFDSEYLSGYWSVRTTAHSLVK